MEYKTKAELEARTLEIIAQSIARFDPDPNGALMGELDALTELWFLRNAALVTWPPPARPAKR